MADSKAGLEDLIGAIDCLTAAIIMSGPVTGAWTNDPYGGVARNGRKVGALRKLAGTGRKRVPPRAFLDNAAENFGR